MRVRLQPSAHHTHHTHTCTHRYRQTVYTNLISGVVNSSWYIPYSWLLESVGQVHRTGTCSQKSNNNGSYTSAPSADTAVYVCVSTKTTIIIITITWATMITVCIYMAQKHHMPMLILMLMLMLTRGLVLPEV